MFNRHSLKLAGHVLVVAAISVTACQRNQPPSSPNVTTTGAQSRESGLWVSGWSYYFRPIKAGVPTDADKGKEVWRDLFSGMARDEKTRELLTRLHGGWPAEFVVVDAKQTKDESAFKAPPSDGVAVVLRVVDINRKEVKTKAGPIPFREIAFGHVVRIKDAVIAELPLGKEEPLAGDALDLAIEDYVLRHAPGWVARRGTGPDTSFEDDQQLRRSVEDAKVPASVEDQRRELDQKIKDYADRARAYYGTKGKP